MQSLYIWAFFCLALALANGEQIISRAEWGSQKPRHTPKDLSVNPANYVVVAHTGTGGCRTRHECTMHMRNYYDLTVKQFFNDDIIYNFLVGGDGNVYEGRGWTKEGQHTPGYNHKSIGIAFLGDFNYKAPSVGQIEAAKKLIAYGVETGKISGNYKLVAQSQVKLPWKPDRKVLETVKTWEHWTQNP